MVNVVLISGQLVRFGYHSMDHDPLFHYGFLHKYLTDLHAREWVMHLICFPDLSGLCFWGGRGKRMKGKGLVNDFTQAQIHGCIPASVLMRTTFGQTDFEFY